MSILFTVGFWVSLLAMGIRFASGLAIGAIGELITEKSGVLNLGIEGIFLMSALSGVFITHVFGNPWLGLLFGGLIGAIFGLLHAFICVTLKVNQALAGLGVFFFGSGFSAVLYGSWSKTGSISIPSVNNISLPIISEIPVLGNILFNHNPMIYLTWLLVVIVWFILQKTKQGLRLRIIGERPDLADTMGLNVFKTRYLATIIGASLMGVAGAFLGIMRYGTFMIGITSGAGWIALAVVYFGRWNPFQTYLGTLLFGVFLALQTKLQSTFPNAPYQLFVMLPYILVIVVLVLISREAVGPEQLGKPYKREEN